MAGAVTHRVNATGLHVVEPTSANRNGESRRGSSSADSPVAKWINDAKDSNVWVAVDEGEVSGTSAGNSCRAVLFRTMKVKGSILGPYRSLLVR
jgi:mixed-linked glucan synthase